MKKMKPIKIQRSIQSMTSDGRTIRGVAAVCDSWSKDLGGFIERIAPGAFTDALIRKSDVMLNVEHDPMKVLARCKYGKGSLTLRATERGLEFETEAPNTTLGNDMLEMLKRGDYQQCSFCFSILPNSDHWERNADNILTREIREIDRLYDVSIVYDPAYDATQVDARSTEMVNIFTKLDALEAEINLIFPNNHE